MANEIVFATKLDKLMRDRGLTIVTLNMRLKEKGLPTLDPSAFRRYRKGKTGVGARLNRNRRYPSILERICIALDCTSADILEY